MWRIDSLVSYWPRWLVMICVVGLSLVTTHTAETTKDTSLAEQLRDESGIGKPEQWVFLDNGQVRLGVKKTSGAGIAWFSESQGRNLVNHWDHGRLIQQSYYGNEDGSLWAKQPWRWNPVQGGDYRGKPAQVLDLQTRTNWLYAKTLPKHWANGADLTNTVMEQWITLTGRVAHVRYKFTYTGTEKHSEQDQEIPAFFVEPDLETLVVYTGDKPWTGDTNLHRSKPGWPNESRAFTEPWAAYVGTNDFGIGAYVRAAKNLTCYRFGDGDPKHGSCSYFAPLTRFSVVPGFVWEYDLYVTIGSINEIRQRFTEIHRQHRP